MCTNRGHCIGAVHCSRAATPSLTHRERAVLRCIRAAATEAEILTTLGLTKPALRRDMRSLSTKLENLAAGLTPIDELRPQNES